jgi:hypothetical protein
MMNTNRTSIDDLSPLGEELDEEHLRLASGGFPHLTYTFGTKWYRDIDGGL